MFDQRTFSSSHYRALNVLLAALHCKEGDGDMNSIVA